MNVDYIVSTNLIIQGLQPTSQSGLLLSRVSQLPLAALLLYVHFVRNGHVKIAHETYTDLVPPSLVYIAMARLGLNTRPTGQRPSNYGNSGQLPIHATPDSRHKSDKFRPDVYKLSATVQTKGSDVESAPHDDDLLKSPNWFSGGFSRPISTEKKKKEPDNESERSLKIKSERSSEEDGMRIMVSKSFYITDEERASRSSRGDSYR